MGLNWEQKDYFSMLLHRDKRSHAALEHLVDDLHLDKDKTINQFVSHSGSEDFLWGLIRLLASELPRVAGNSAYILGTVAEDHVGCYRVLDITTGNKPASRNILPDLTRMLQGDDPESVMNAAGTMGTLAETSEGREWMLSESCLASSIENVAHLLTNDNLWTASNAALVLARISIAEEGCIRILEHSNHADIISKLIRSLGVDEAGRGMNAAFAIGRICDMEEGRTKLLSMSDSEKMLTSLARMLCCDDPGASKNACFAMSCLATNSNGLSRILKNGSSNEVITCLAILLSAEDSETGWFAAMTLRTLASQPKGCQRLRDHQEVTVALEAILRKVDVNDDLIDEVNVTMEILKRLSKPELPVFTVTGPQSIEACWEEVQTKSGFPIKYQIFDGTKCLYKGPERECVIEGLGPHTTYSFRLRACTEIEESPFSDLVQVTTDEDVPTPPQNLRILGATTTQLKIGWEPPAESNGVLRGYYIYNGKNQIEHTYELSSIITGLAGSTPYTVEVCAATLKGRGERAACSGNTTEQGAHSPSKPALHVLGRNEIHVTWDHPEVPLGKINKYEVLANGKTVHSGMENTCTARRLVPDKEYTFVVVAITTEGKFESKPSKKRTAKDEHDGTRAPLYVAPPRKENIPSDDQISPTNKPPPSPKKRKTLTPAESLHSRATSATSVKERLSLPALRVCSKMKSRAEDVRHAPLSARSNTTLEKPKPSIPAKLLDDVERSSSGQSSKSSNSSLKESDQPIKIKYTQNATKSKSDSSIPSVVPAVSRQPSSQRRASASREILFVRDATLPRENKTVSKHRIVRRTSSSDESESTNRIKTSEPARLRVDVPTGNTQDGGSHRKTDSEKEPHLITGANTSVWKFDANPVQPGLVRSGVVQDYGMNATSQPFTVEEKSTEPDPDWIEHAKKIQRIRYDLEMCRQLNHMNLTSPPRTPHNDFFSSPPRFPERAKTFINSHRPSKKPGAKALTSPHIMAATANAAQWVPELPSRSQKTSTKFIPMEFRSPPCSSAVPPPIRMQRETTNVNVYGRGPPGRRLETLTRSQTQVDMKTRPEPGNHGSDLMLRSQRIDTHTDRMQSATVRR